MSLETMLKDIPDFTAVFAQHRIDRTADMFALVDRFTPILEEALRALKTTATMDVPGGRPCRWVMQHFRFAINWDLTAHDLTIDSLVFHGTRMVVEITCMDDLDDPWAPAPGEIEAYAKDLAEMHERHPDWVPDNK